MATLSYPVDVSEAEEGGFLAALGDWGHVTQGETRAQALEAAQDLLHTLVSAYVAEGLDIPVPSAAAGRPVVGLPPVLAAKAGLYGAWRAAGIGKAELARRLGIGPGQVEQLFDLRRAARIEEIERALRALGKTLVIDIRDAA